MKNKSIINLTSSHRGIGSSTFTGRPQGVQVRAELKLDKFDFDKNSYVITIPEGTISFNPSFYLGLFFKSIKNLNGFKNFSDKYDIQLLESNSELKELLLEDFDECKRQSENEFIGKTGIDLL
tara:strand:+ start:6816 stop:7184 length:369 start_codon:yes stop_codon:yes gene_type:complete